jgi:hypothetical protein
MKNSPKLTLKHRLVKEMFEKTSEVVNPLKRLILGLKSNAYLNKLG